MKSALIQLGKSVDAYEVLTINIENLLKSVDKEIKRIENIMIPFLFQLIGSSSTVTDTLLNYLTIFFTNISTLLDHLWVLDDGRVDTWYKERLVPSRLVKQIMVGGDTIDQSQFCSHVADATVTSLQSSLKNIQLSDQVTN